MKNVAEGCLMLPGFVTEQVFPRSCETLSSRKPVLEQLSVHGEAGLQSRFWASVIALLIHTAAFLWPARAVILLRYFS